MDHLGQGRVERLRVRLELDRVRGGHLDHLQPLARQPAQQRQRPLVVDDPIVPGQHQPHRHGQRVRRPGQPGVHLAAGQQKLGRGGPQPVGVHADVIAISGVSVNSSGAFSGMANCFFGASARQRDGQLRPAGHVHPRSQPRGHQHQAAKIPRPAMVDAVAGGVLAAPAYAQQVQLVGPGGLEDVVDRHVQVRQQLLGRGGVAAAGVGFAAAALQLIDRMSRARQRVGRSDEPAGMTLYPVQHEDRQPFAAQWVVNHHRGGISAGNHQPFQVGRLGPGRRAAKM